MAKAKDTKPTRPQPKGAKPAADKSKAAVSGGKDKGGFKMEMDDGKGGPREPSRLRVRYKDEIVGRLMERFKYDNVMRVPRLEKVVVNMGVGEAIVNAKALETAVVDLMLITGQKPLVTKARKSIAAFKLRAGVSIGAKVTLRGDRMYSFLDKLFNVVLPRIRDFRGLNSRSFDGRGNYAFGLREQIIFPEIEYDKVDKSRGMDIIIVTTAQTDEEAREFIKMLGAPIKDEQAAAR